MDDGERDRTNDKWEDGREERQRHRTALWVQVDDFTLWSTLSRKTTTRLIPYIRNKHGKQWFITIKIEMN
ncbi:hypothetical protein BLOT_001370, partial [Blomia tropicalis]